MKEVITKIKCDRCGKEFKKKNAEIIEHLDYYHGCYGHTGGGGSHYEDLELCHSCSKKFIKFMDNPNNYA